MSREPGETEPTRPAHLPGTGLIYIVKLLSQIFFEYLNCCTQVVAEIDTQHECEESGLFPIPDSDCTRYRNCVEVETELVLN